MQTPFSSSKPGLKSFTEMARFPKLCKNPIGNVMLQLRAVSKVVVKFITSTDLILEKGFIKVESVRILRCYTN